MTVEHQAPTPRGQPPKWIWAAGLLGAAIFAIAVGRCSLGQHNETLAAGSAKWPSKELVLSALTPALPPSDKPLAWGPVITDKHGQRFYAVWADDDHTLRAFVDDSDRVIAYGLTVNTTDDMRPYVSQLLGALEPQTTARERTGASESLSGLAKEAGDEPGHLDVRGLRLSVTGGVLHNNLRVAPVDPK